MITDEDIVETLDKIESALNMISMILVAYDKRLEILEGKKDDRKNCPYQ